MVRQNIVTGDAKSCLFGRPRLEGTPESVSAAILRVWQAAEASLPAGYERCFAPACSSGPLTAHYLFDQSDDHHQDTAADPAGYNLTDDGADIEAACPGGGGFGSATD